MNQLWGFGTATVDFRIVTADYGEHYKDKLLAQETLCLGGGAVANCLVQAARLGGSVGWLGKLGNDSIAKKIITMLKDENIDCSRVRYSQTECSPFNVAVYAGEHKRRVGGFLLPNALMTLNEEELQHFANAFSPGDWLAIEVGEIPLEYCIKLSQLAKAKGAFVAIDVDLDPIRQCKATSEQADDLFRCADLLIPNLTSMASLYTEREPDCLCRILYEKYGVPVVVTAGADGAYYITKSGQSGHQPAFPVEVKDTVGAGDAFHGGMLYALVSGEALSRAVLWGTACAAVNCTAFGAREGMPNQKQVLKEMELYG